MLQEQAETPENGKTSEPADIQGATGTSGQDEDLTEEDIQVRRLVIMNS